MAHTTVVAISNDHIDRIIDDSEGFVKKICREKNYDPEEYPDDQDVKVFRSVYHGGEPNSTVYLFDGYKVIHMDENSGELKRIMAEDSKYFKKLIRLMKEKTNELEKMSKEFEQSQIPF
jgi:hypothetical protein